MAILVDEAVWPWRGRHWAHLVSDTSYAELHAFADRLGIPPRAFQGDHYDLPSEYRLEAIALGAEAVSGRELLGRLRAAGLRLSPRSAAPVTTATPSPRSVRGRPEARGGPRPTDVCEEVCQYDILLHEKNSKFLHERRSVGLVQPLPRMRRGVTSTAARRSSSIARS